jgi:RNA-binding protein YlmH
MKCAAFQVSLPISNILLSTNTRNVKIQTTIASMLPLKMLTKIDVDHLLEEGSRAADEWDIFVTPFLNEEDGQLLEGRLKSRGDVGYVRIGGSGFVSPLRSRFVMSNTDLELDVNAVNDEYCTILCVDHVDTATMSGQNPWPHLLSQIGVGLEYVGDVVVEENKAYLVVDPTVTKQCCRLLPKEMRGVGITVSILDREDYLPSDGLVVSMQLGRLDKRALKYK